MNKELNNTCNIMKNSLVRRIILLEDTILSQFTQMDFDLTPQIKKGSPLYEHFIMVNPQNSSEKFSNVKMGTSEKHDSGVIEILSDPISYDDTGHGLIIVTRHYKMYDGTFHFSFQVNQDWGFFGAFVRYLDQFN